MTPKRIFLIINLALLAVTGFSIYYLVNASYASPPDIRRSKDLVKILKSGEKAGSVAVTTESPYKDLRSAKDFMGALYPYTPTETPTPAPTATPVSISVMIDSWLLTGIDSDYVEITDQRTNETFELRLNGESKVVDFQGSQMSIKLCGVDLDSDPPKAVFCGDGAQGEKFFQ